MTTQSQAAFVAREPSERAGRRDPGSVLQALQGLNPAPLPAVPRRAIPQGPSRAFLPARPGKSSLSPEGTGVIDVRALAAMGLRRTQAAVATPSPASPRPAFPAAPERPSPRMLQVRAFMLGVLCTGALTGVLLVRVAAATPDQAAPMADPHRGQPGPSAAADHAPP